MSEREVGGGYAHSVKRAFTPRGSVTGKQDRGASRSETCRDARRGLRWYRVAERKWRSKMGAGITDGRSSLRGTCPHVRLLAKHARQAAHAARVRYERWWRYQWEWRRWLPDKWRRIGWCETHLNWRHWYSPSGYQGAFGFAPSSWDGFKGEADPKAGPYPADANQATPRQQYEVALAIWRHFGFSGWGCRNA